MSSRIEDFCPRCETEPLIRSILLTVGLAVSAIGLTSPLQGAVGDEGRITEIVREIGEHGDRTPRGLFEELGRMKSGGAYIALKNALRDLRGAQAKYQVFRALRHMASDAELGPKALSLVEKAARGRDRAEAGAAARALSEFGLPGHATMLDVARHAHDGRARANALRGVLQAIAQDPSAENLETILGAIQVPATCGRSVALKVLSGFRSEKCFAAFARTVGDKKVPLAVKQLTLDAMGLVPLDVDATTNGGADRVLSKAASGRDGVLQYGALEAMARRGGTLNLRLVEKLARAKDPSVRRAALLVGARVNARGGDPLSLAVARDSIARQAAAIALGSLEGDDTLQALHKLLGDEDRVVRAEALRQVADRGDLRSVDALIQQLGVESGRLRGDLRSALETLTGRNYGLNARVWGKFWKAEGESFVPPTPEERAAAAAARETEGAEKAVSEVAFYGIEILSDRFTLVVDISGSMKAKAYTGATRLAVAKKQITQTLKRLREGVLFNLVPFSSGVESMDSEMVVLDEQTRQEAHEYAEALRADGGTNIHDALEAAFEDERVDTIYLLSDGSPSAGPIVDSATLRAEVKRWNSTRDITIHCIAVGQDHPLLRGLAEDSHGEYVRVD